MKAEDRKSYGTIKYIIKDDYNINEIKVGLNGLTKHYNKSDIIGNTITFSGKGLYIYKYHILDFNQENAEVSIRVDRSIDLATTPMWHFWL